APAPVMTSLSPSSATTGGSEFRPTINGSTFHQDSVVRWNGVSLRTPNMTSGGLTTYLTAQIPVADIASAGTATAMVYTPGSGATCAVIRSGGTQTLGIDVSHFQNDAGPIDWSNVYSNATSPKRFVFIKAS